MKCMLLLLLVIPLILIIPVTAQADHCPPGQSHRTAMWNLQHQHHTSMSVMILN